jgi:predicted RNA-binding Zn ribbon-like protein
VDFSHYNDDTVQLAVDLVNTLERYSGEDSLTTLDDLRTFVDTHWEQWGGVDCSVTEPTEQDLAEIRALRARLRSAFDADSAEAAALRLNDVLLSSRAAPRVSLHGAGPHLHFEPDTGRLADRVGAATAMALSVVLCDFGFERFGICESSTCEDVYIDTSRNLSRRNCSSTCTTRENVAAYRKRAAAN